MTEEVRARAIEPFFTTKPIGQGTGLGLSQVYAVVRESGGTLAIDSEPGRGTTVRMILPAGAPADRADRRQVAAADDAVGVRSREQTRVLVVDDDKLVRRFMADSLRSLQYHVIDAENGAQALAALERERFDLLLVDFAMPGMNGADVARAAQRTSAGYQGADGLRLRGQRRGRSRARQCAPASQTFRSRRARRGSGRDAGRCKMSHALHDPRIGRERRSRARYARLTPTVIWLHGLGADGYDFVPIVDGAAAAADAARCASSFRTRGRDR